MIMKFTGKMSKMGEKIIVIVPKEYRVEAEKNLGKTFKFEVKEI